MTHLIFNMMNLTLLVLEFKLLSELGTNDHCAVRKNVFVSSENT